MKQFWTIVISCLVFGKFSGGEETSLRFPENFTLGAGSSSYQVEGAWNVSDKGESVWDRYTHTHPEVIADGSNGDVACNSYYKYKEDVQMVKSMGLDFYRFSISWTRVLPTGFTNVISEEGLQYYKNLTEELVANGIEPVVTLYHWDHPQILEEMGGWTNELMVDWFVAYARIIFKALGDHVKIWTTINEPDNFCLYGYNTSLYAPGKTLNGVGIYLCVHNTLKAHAKTYHMYNEEFRSTQKGELGILAACSHSMALNESDTLSAEAGFDFHCGWVVHPIYTGDYPTIMKERIAEISKAQGYEESRLPEFSDEWKSMINGSADYLGINHYKTQLVSPDPAYQLGIYNDDDGIIASSNESWPATAFPTMSVYPEGFGDLLRLIKNKYGNPPVRVMENGFSDTDGKIDDYDRINAYHGYLKELLIAVNEDDCNVVSYSAWALMDNMEWNFGYTMKFGLFNVDFADANRTRTAKRSTSWWKNVSETRVLQPMVYASPEKFDTSTRRQVTGTSIDDDHASGDEGVGRSSGSGKSPLEVTWGCSYFVVATVVTSSWSRLVR